MKTAIIINSDTFGNGDDKLGKQLMGSFLRKLWSADTKPGLLIFYNSGVKLLAEGSEVLDALDGLYESGVELIACGTCITFFELKDKIRIGRVSDMGEISGAILTYDKVITV